LPKPDASVHVANELYAFERFCAALTLDSGEPMLLEPFQLVMLADYFDGVRETLVLLSKKNGKTTLLAALALYHLLVTDAPGGAGAECVIGAASRDQASILYEQATGFVARSEGLQARVAVKGGYRMIRSRRNTGRIRVLAADVDTADGVLPTLALVDELGRHKRPDLYGVFRDGLGPRRGQMLGISAAGSHEATPLGLMRAAAYRLPRVERDGRYVYARSLDQSFVMHEWALLRDDDLHDFDAVKEVNPASWQPIELLKERHDSPSMLPWQWARFACGVWMSESAMWVNSDDWYACEEIDALQTGDAIALGFDGSRFNDATALVACRLSDGLLQPLGYWEAPEGAPDDWEIPGDEVAAKLADVMERYRVVRGYFDPPLWQSEIDAWARDFGDRAVMRFYTSRARMMGAVERFRTDVVATKVVHVGDAHLTEHVLNAQMRESRGGYWLVKNEATRGKIDCAVAAVLAYEARSDAIAAGEDRLRTRVPVSL
jgi:phage terminase large subunit-like protein